MRLASIWPAVLCSGVLCIDMQVESPALTTSACVHDKVLRVDIRSPMGDSPTWLIDFGKDTSTFLSPAARTYRSDPLGVSIAALHKQPATYKAQVKETRARKRAAAATTFVAQSAEKDSGGDCFLYSMTTDGQSAQVCMRELTPEISKEVVRVVGLVRAAQKKHEPLVLQGLPLLNVDFPIYDAKGLVAKNLLPVAVKLPNQVLRFNYRQQDLSDDWFTWPADFTRTNN